MGGLSSVDRKNSSLRKEAGEGSLENNIKHLITDEAYNQLSSKFPNLVTFIVGINIIEKIDDKTIIGGAVLSNGEQKLIVPVVYVNGIVDATTFIYSEDNDTLLALTKKVVSYILLPDKSIDGTSYKPSGSDISFDFGDINKLFVPPKTYNPKIASGDGGMVFAVLEKVSSVRDALIEKLSSKEMRDRFDEAYGAGASEHVMNMGLNKVASMKDDTPPEAIFSLEKIASSSWEHKEEAAREFAKNGFVISHGYHAQDKMLQKTSSVGTRLEEITGNETLESISASNPGVYYVYSLKDLKPIEIVISKSGINECNTHILGEPFGYDRSDLDDGNPVVGTRINISDSKLLKPFSYLPEIKNNTTISMVFIKNGEIFNSSTFILEDKNIIKGLGSTIIKINFGNQFTAVNIEEHSDASPVILGRTLYVGDRNVRIFKNDYNYNQEIPVRMRDLDYAYNDSHDIVKIAFDGAEYRYNHKSFSKEGLVGQLLNEGFDKNSIYSLVKTATDKGSAEYAALNAKLDILATVVTNLAGQIQAQQKPEKITATQGLSTAAPQNASTESAPAENANTAQNVKNGDGSQRAAVTDESTMMPDTRSGMPTPQQEAQMQAQRQQDTAADQQLLAQTPQPGVQQDDAQQGSSIDGMNPSLDPQILKSLSELKDSKVMDVGVVSMLANSEAVGSVMQEYRGDILNGASAVGKILMNMMVRKNDVIKDLGEKKYSQTVKMLKIVFTKTSDLYVDIVKMELEDSGKMVD